MARRGRTSARPAPATLVVELRDPPLEPAKERLRVEPLAGRALNPGPRIGSAPLVGVSVEPRPQRAQVPAAQLLVEIAVALVRASMSCAAYKLPIV